MRVIAIVNQKGGCGKTTVSINLASAAGPGRPKNFVGGYGSAVTCAVGLAVPEDQIEQSIYDVLISRSRNEPLKITEILWQISERFELAASIDLSAYDQQMAGIPDRECCLKNVLHDFRKEFDYVIVDCPPAVGLLTFSALRAATDVIVPVETGYFALHGLSKRLETLSILCKRRNQEINVKVLASMYDIRTKMAREILAELRNHFSDKMFKTVVNFNTKLKEATSLGQPINEYDPSSKGQKNLAALAEEVIGTEIKQKRHEVVNTLANQLESISSTADELLKAAKPEIKAIQTVKPKTERLQPINTEEKLSNYYGVNHMNGSVVFVTLYPRARQVQIAGDFNGWQPSEANMSKVGSNGTWQTKMNLPAGKYRYRLVVDGQWQQDPYNGMTETNPFGDMNSVLEVK